MTTTNAPGRQVIAPAQWGPAPRSDVSSASAVTAMFRMLGSYAAADPSPLGALRAVSTVAAHALPGVDCASITRLRNTTFETIASTDEAAVRADALQYARRQGPCVDAVGPRRLARTHDLASDPRWPQFGPAAVSLGMRSVLSLRVTDDDDVVVGLNLYSHRIGTFEDHTRDAAQLLAIHAAMIVAARVARAQADNLHVALASSREIGIAVGVLMTTGKVTRDDAFDLLRGASQHAHRKLRDIAAEVAETGALEFVDRR